MSKPRGRPRGNGTADGLLTGYIWTNRSLFERGCLRASAKMLVGDMAGIQDKPLNPKIPMLTTHANPKAGRDSLEDTLGQGFL